MTIDRPGARLITAMAIAIANFMIILDTTIAVVSVPAISGALGATPSQGTWILTSYTVCIAVVLPLSGWVSVRYGEVRTFAVATLVFAITSWLCGMADNFELLVLLRALQGMSSGLVVPLSQTLLLRIYPPAQHGFALSLWTVTASVAPVVGPMLGGFITDQVGWPWVFFINVPIGVLCSYIVWQRMHTMESRTFKKPVDGIGMLLLVCCILTLQLLMDRGHELDWLSSPSMRVCLAVSVIAFIAFCVWEREESHPIIDYTLLKVPSFAISSIMISIFYITYISATVLYSIWMQTVLDYTPTWAGVAIAGSGIPAVMFVFFVGKYIYRLNLRVLIVTGSMSIMYAVYLQAQMNTHITLAYIFISRIIMGTGLALLFAPLMGLSLISVPKEKMASAAGFFNFFRMLASSIGIAIGVTLWEHRTIFHRQRLVEDLTPLKSASETAFATVSNLVGGDQLVGWSLLERLAQKQASTLALNDTFYVFMATFLIVLALTPFVPRRLAQAPVGALDG